MNVESPLYLQEGGLPTDHRASSSKFQLIFFHAGRTKILSAIKNVELVVPRLILLSTRLIT